MRIASARISKGLPPTTLFESPRKYSDRSLQSVAESITKRADIATLSVAMSELYLDALQRVIDVRSDFDRAREVKAANGPRWKNAMRTARFACRDEEKLLCLVDRAIRGVCDCVGLRTRISFETIAEIIARKDPYRPEELRRQRTRDRMTIALLQKALLFGFSVPAELLVGGSQDELNESLREKIDQVELEKRDA